VVPLAPLGISALRSSLAPTNQGAAMKLYNNDFSPNSKRVRVVAREVGSTLDVVQVDFAKGEHKAPSYMALNPNGKVPTFDIDGMILWESPAVLVYFAERFPEKGLLPKEPLGRAEAFKWMFWNASHLEPPIFTIGFERLVKPMMGGKSDQATIDAATQNIQRFAPVLNAHLEGKEWMLGDAFSIADICIATTVEFGGIAKVDLSTFKHIGAWLGRMQARDSWKKG
jgi:glutathione S-transferase